MKFRTIKLLSNSYPITSLCKFLEVSRSGFYKYLQNNNQKDLDVVNKIKLIQDKCKRRYGYRRVQIALEKQFGLHINHKKVLRLMNKYNLLSKIRRKYIYTKPNEVLHYYANLYNRNFNAEDINKKWTTDITYIVTPEGRLYLSVIRDVFDGYIVAYKYSTHIDSKLVADTLKLAYKNNKIDGTILHSDQGATYTTLFYYNLTKEYGITPSMSRKATPLDNAPAESFFSAFKTECIYLEKPKTIKEAKELCDEYIDFYNNERIQLKQQSCPNEIRQRKIANVG